MLMSEYMGLVCTIVREKLGTVCDEFEMESCAGDIFIEFYNGIDKYSEEKGSVNYTENMQAIIFGVMSVLYNKPYEEFAGAVGNTEKK